MLLKGSLNLSWSYLLRKLEQTTEVLGYIPVQPTRGGKGKFGKDEERLEGEEGVVPRTGTLEFVFEELFRGMGGGIGLEEGNGIGIALWWRDEGKVRGSNGLKPYPLVILVLSSSSALIGISDPLCLSCNPIGQGIDGSLVQKRGCQAHSLVNQDDVSKSDLERIISLQRLVTWVALSIPYFGNHSCLWVNEEDAQNPLQPLSAPIPELGQVGGTKGKVMNRDSSSF